MAKRGKPGSGDEGLHNFLNAMGEQASPPPAPAPAPEPAPEASMVEAFSFLQEISGAPEAPKSAIQKPQPKSAVQRVEGQNQDQQATFFLRVSELSTALILLQNAILPEKSPHRDRMVAIALHNYVSAVEDVQKSLGNDINPRNLSNLKQVIPGWKDLNDKNIPENAPSISANALILYRGLMSDLRSQQSRGITR